MSNEVKEEVYDQLAALIREHRTTLIFVNTRRMAERAARIHVRAREHERHGRVLQTVPARAEKRRLLLGNEGYSTSLLTGPALLKQLRGRMAAPRQPD